MPVKKAIRKILIVLLPGGSLRRQAAKKVVRALGIRLAPGTEYYNIWMTQRRQNIPLNPPLRLTKDDPLISVVVPVYNTPPRYLWPLAYSIVSQTYEKWELVLVDASTKSVTKKCLENCAAVDRRIRLVQVPNKGISVNTNEGIKSAKGGYIVFADHDDILDEMALAEVVKAIRQNPLAEIFYTDEDKVSEDGEKYFSPHLKPDWSPDLLLQVNYITHLVAIKKSLADKIGDLDSSKDGAQDFDFLLRATDTAGQIVHIPRILYHWRAAYNSTAQDFSAKSDVLRAGQASLEEYLERKRIKAKVVPRKDAPGFYDIDYRPSVEVSVIITPMASEVILKLYIDLLLLKTQASHVKTIRIISSLQIRAGRPGVKTTWVPAGPKFLAEALDKAGESIILIDKVLLPQSKDWIDKIDGILQFKRVAAAAPMIINEEDKIEDAGLVAQNGSLVPLFTGMSCKETLTPFGDTGWTRDVSALSGSVTVLRRKEIQPFAVKNPATKTSELIREFTLKNSADSRQNVIMSNVKFINFSINLADPDSSGGLFNPNLIDRHGMLELATPEQTAINVLLHLKDRFDDEAKEEALTGTKD